MWGTGAAVAVTPGATLDAACAVVRQELDAMDAACSRFRPDSDLSKVNRSAGTPVRVGAGCMQALQVACRAAERTGGAVDPTVGTAVCALGYDRDFDALVSAPPPSLPLPPPQPAIGWRSVILDPGRGTVVIPAGAALDLGATAKALCADRAAARIAAELGASAVVDLGGDVAVGGPSPEGGWQVAVVESARHEVLPEPLGSDQDGADRPAVTLWRGGLASSGTSVRTWVRGDRQLHHIVDPATGWPAAPVWQMVTVAAGSCVEANTLSTAAVVWGEDAPFRVAQAGVAARFVRAADGEVLAVGGWPGDRPGGAGGHERHRRHGHGGRPWAPPPTACGPGRPRPGAATASRPTSTSTARCTSRDGGTVPGPPQ